MCKKKNVFSFGVGLTVLALAFIFSAQSAQAAATGVDFKGDLAWDGSSYVIRVYDETTADPCPGIGALGSHVGALGDATYNDDNDYTVADFATADDDASVYLCSGTASGDLLLKYEDVAVVTDGAYYIDFGKIIGSSLHNDLDNDYVAMCSALGGTKLSTQDKQVDADGNSYTQYYAINCGLNGVSCPDTAYILFDQNNAANCTWDNDKSTGKKITIDNSPAENYGVYFSYSPDTKVTGDLHSGADLNAVRFEIEDSNALSVGLAIESYTDNGNNPDGANLDDDYIIYYDKPAAGDITVRLVTGSNGTTTISNVSTSTFDDTNVVGDYDFVAHLSDDGSDGLPSDVNNVTIAPTFATPNDVVAVASAPHGTGVANQDYDIYIAPSGAAENVLYKTGGVNTVFTKSVNFAAEGDDTVDVGKISGEAATGIEDAGTADSVRTYSDNICTTEISSQTVQPAENGAGDDYATYFDDSDTDMYTKIVKDATANYTTCGNKVLAATLALQVATVDLTIQVTGNVHDDIDRVAVDGDVGDSDATSADTCGAYVDLAGAGPRTYFLYASGSVDLVDPVDDTSSFFVVETGALTTELVERTKDLGTSQTVNVGRATGNLHADLQNVGANDAVRVYTTAACGTELSSEDRITGAGATYTQYYEQNGATTYLGITEADGANDYVTCGVEVAFGANGDSQTVHVDKRVLGSVPDAIDTVGIDYDTDNVDEYTQTVVAATNPDTYKMYMPSDEASDISFYIAGPTKALERQGKIFTGASTTVDVAEFSGSILDAFYEAAGAPTVDVWNDYTAPTTQYNSTSTITDAGATDDYTVFFEDTGAAEARDLKFVDGAGYISWMNDATADTDNTIDPGDNIDFDLEYKVSGTAPIDIAYVTVRDSSGGGDPDPFGAAEPAVNGTYVMYVANGAGSYILIGGVARVWDANDLDGGLMQYGFQVVSGTDVYTFTTGFSLFAANQTHSVVKVSGTVPATAATLDQGANDYVFARDASAEDCNVAVDNTVGESRATIANVTGVYDIYFEASTALYVTFCHHGAAAVDPDYQTQSTKSLAAGTDYTLNLAVLTGKMDTNFSTGANADIEVYDSFQTTKLGDTDNTSFDGAAILVTEAAGNYYVYFEQSGTAAALAALTDEAVRTEADAIADVAMKITDHGGYVMGVIGIEEVEGTTAPTAGAIITVDLIYDLDGTVPDPGGGTDYVIAQDNTDEFCLATVTNGTGVYRMVCPTVASLGGGANGNLDYVIESDAVDELNYERGAEWVDDETFDANKITVTTHADVGDDAQDLVQIYTTAALSGDADCTGTLLSSKTTGATPNPVVYFRMTGANDLHTNLKINSRESEKDYVSCTNTETDQGAAGSAIAYSANQLVSGTVASGITNIYLDNDGDSTNWEVNATVTGTTTPASFRGYYAGAANTDVKATAAAVTKLIVTDKNYAAGGSFTVGKVSGTNHADLNGGTIVVYSGAGCTTQVSSETANPAGGTWTQYFEVTGGGSYYTKATTGAFSTCKTSGNALVNLEATLISFSGKLSGTVPDQSTVDAAAPGAANSISSVGVDLTTNGTTDAYLSAVVDGGGTTTYQLYYDAAAGNDADNQVNFWGVNDGTGGPLLSRLSQDLTGGATINTAMMWGEADANLEAGANDFVKVCDDNLATITAGMAGTCVSYISTNDNGNGVTVADGGFGTADYSIHFVVGADTEGYLEIETNDATGGISYTYRIVGAGNLADVAITAGDFFNADLDARIYGKMVEQYDYTTAIPNVLIDALNVAHAITAVRGFSNATGFYDLYDFATETRDFSFSKAGYITEDYATVTVNTDYDAPFNDTSAFDAVVLGADNPVEENAAGEGADENALATGIKVVVKDGGTNPITDATVAVYNCTAGGDGSNPSACTTWAIVATCTNPAGNCTRTGANAAGNGLAGEYYFAGIAATTYVQFRVSDPTAPAIFETVFSPDSSETTNSFVVSNTTQLSATVVPYNPAPECVLRVGGGNGTYTTGGNLYAKIGQTVNVYMDCGQTGLTSVTLDGSNIDASEGAAVMLDGGAGVDLTAGDGTYSYQLTVDQAGTAAYSITATASDGVNTDNKDLWVNIDNTVPGTVTAVTDAGATDNDGVTTWTWTAAADANSGVAYYTVKIDNSGDTCASPETTTTTTSTTYTESGLADGSTYYACVNAVDNVGTAGTVLASNGITIDTTVPNQLVLNAPSNAGYSSDTTPDLTWFDVDGETGYEIQIDDDGTFAGDTGDFENNAAIAAGTVTYTVTGPMVTGTTYYWRVRALDSTGDNGIWSEAWHFTVDAVAPTVTLTAITDPQNTKSFLVEADANEEVTCRLSTDTAVYSNMGITMTETNDGNDTHQATLTVPVDADYTVYATCQDAAGNTGTANQAAVTVFSTAPTVTAATPNGGTYKTAQQIAITTDVNAKCRYATSDISYAGMGAGNQFTGGEDGVAHTITPVPGAQGLIHYYVRCVSTVAAVEMSSSVIVYYTYDTAVPTYAFVSMDNTTAVKVGTVVTAYYEASEDMAADPTATICGEAATVTRNGRLVKVVKTLTAAAAGNDIVLTGGTDVATNTATTLTDAGRLALDKVVPVLTVPLPTTNQTSRTFSVSVNGGEAGLSCRASTDADANTYAEMGLTLDYISANVYGTTISVPADGNYTVYFACQDTAGNETITNTGAAFTVDTIAPIEQSIVINSNALYSTSVALTVKIYSEGADGYSLSCEPDVAWSANVAYTAGSYTDVAFNLDTVNGTLGCTNVDGLKTVYVRFKDDNNNYSYLSDTITLDATAPVIGVLTAANTAGQREVGLTWTAAVDATSGISYYDVYRDPATGVNKTDTKVASGLTTLGYRDYPEDGTWYYTVYATDKAGNESVLFVEKTVTVDTTPVGIVSTPVFGTYNVAGLAAANGAKITPDVAGTCKWDTMDATYAIMDGAGVDGEFAVLAATAYDLTALADADDYTLIQGLNEIYVRCKDASNNENLNSTHISFIYDTVAPTYDLTIISASGTSQTRVKANDTVTLTIVASELMGVDPTIVLGGVAPDAACTETGTTYVCVWTMDGDFADGSTPDLSVSAGLDPAANGDTDLAQADIVTVDKTAPTVTLTAPAAAAVVTNTAFTVTLNGGEANLTCKYKVQADAGAVPAYADMADYLADLNDNTYTGTATVPANGVYDVYAACQDTAGNIGTDDNQDFTVDNVGPAITAVEPDPEDYATAAKTITITSGEAISCYYATDDIGGAVPGAGWTAFDTDQGTVSPDATGLVPAAQGRAFYYVKCEDAVGNDTVDNIVVTWFYDSVAPGVPIRMLPANATTYITSSVMAWSGSTDTGSQVNHYTLQIDEDPLFASALTVDNLATTAYALTAGNIAALTGGVNYWRVQAVDNAGNASGYQGTNQTVVIDKTAPTVEEMDPADNNATTSIGTDPLLIFDERIEPSTLTPANIQLRKYSDNSVVVLHADGGILAENYITEDGAYKTYVIIVPAANLAYNTQYYIAISANVVDMSGNAIVAWDATNKANHEFTTAAQQTGALGVIGVTQVRSYGTADNTYANGWEWVIRATIPTNELNVSLKFANWTGINSNSIAVANNMRYYCEQAPLHNSELTAITVTTANSYADGPIVVSAALDDDANTIGVQVNIHVQVKIPAATAGGSYSTSYGIQTQQ